MKRCLFVVSVITVFAFAPCVSANTIFVDTTCNIASTYGLCVQLDGGPERTYVLDFSPAGETTYRGSFTIRPATLNMTPPNNHVILLAMQENASPPPVNMGVLRLVLVKAPGDRFFVRGFARLDGSAFYRFIGGVGLGSNPNKPWRIGWEWQAASFPGANDGILRLYRDDQLMIGRTDLDTDTWAIDLVRMGCVAFPDASSSGIYHMDTFESFRTLAP